MSWSYEAFVIAIQDSCFFSSEFYLNSNPDVAQAGVDPSWHYFHYGWKENRNPSALFDMQRYLAENPDVKSAGLEPLFHFLVYGRSEGRAIHRIDATSINQSSDHNTPIPDEVLHNTSDPDIGSQEIDVADNEDEKKAQSSAQSSNTVASIPTPDLTEAAKLKLRLDLVRSPTKEQIAAVASHFSVEFYLENYPDIGSAGVDPLKHYMLQGWRELRDPSPYFSTLYYIKNSPDVIDARLNPFYHFVASGRLEGRLAKSPNGFRHAILGNLKSVDEKIAEARLHFSRPALSSIAKFDEWFDKNITLPNRLILSFSHDNFMANIGGVQILMRRELFLLKQEGFSQISFFPALALAHLNPLSDNFFVGVLLDGEFAGYFKAEDIQQSIIKRKIGHEFGARFIIHNLLGQNMDFVESVLLSCGCQSGYFWVHDYASIYNNWNLLINDVKFRGVPRKDRPDFDLCEYARWAFDQPKEIGRIFRSFKTTVISPSQTALDLWLEAGLHVPDKVYVVPHCTLMKNNRNKITATNSHTKVAFVGHAASHKGWPIFTEISDRARDRAHLSFFHFGLGGSAGMNFTRVTVQPEPDGTTNMIKALSDAEIDIAVIPSICPETFGLVAYEAVAAGAKVLCLKDSGNVAAFIQETGLGRVMASEAELIKLFESDTISELTELITPLFDLNFSKMTLEVMGM
jgi:hypothetical protein